MAYGDAAAGKRRGRERIRKRTEDRIANGICTACGEGRRGVDRARDEEGRRAAGAPRHADPEKARARERQRSHKRTAERAAQGLCATCGRAPSVPGRRECAPCAETRRARQRERYREARAAGQVYGGRDPETCREVARRARRKRREAGLCRACGAHPPADGAILCEPCLTMRRAADRAAYAARRAAGLCTGCGTEVADGAARCASCAARQAAGVSREKKNAAKRRRYIRRRAAGRCTSCNAPSQGMSLCARCARRSYERSAYVRTMPVHPPRFAVFLRGGDECLAVLDDEMEVAGFLAFARLAREQVEVVADAPALASLAAHD